MAIDAAMEAPRLNMNDSISKILQSLNLEEKCTLLSGKNMWETADIPRLGIRSLKTSDGPAGVRGSRWTDGTHTTYIPCGISLAATFDPDLIQRVGKILGAEAKTKGAHVLLAPTMNISRSPFGGRNFENFGEDPYLTGVMASSYIEGVQSEGVGACMKHYVANDMETRRFNMDEQIDERTLREIYLKPFDMALKADPWTAMTAYPKINGEHADTSRFLVYDILRQEWGYDGLVMSDWGGLNSTIDSIRATTDLEMPGPPLRYGKALLRAVESGAVSEEEHINPSVERLLRLLARAQLLDSPQQNGTNGIHEGIEGNEAESDTPESRQTAREAASQGIVLLKNTGILPLKPSKLRSLAIIGPNAKTPTTGGTGSAIVNPYYITTPFDSLSHAAKSANPDIQITHHCGIFTHLQPPLIGDCLTNPTTGSPGLRVDFFSGNTFSGDIISSSDWHNSLVYFMSDGDVPPSLRGTTYSYKATGLLRPSATGTYDFSLSNTDWTQISGNFMNCGSVEVFASRELDAGKTYRLRVDNLVVPPPTRPHDNTLFHKISGVRVGMLFRHDEEQMFRDAVAAAEGVDAVVLVVGHNNDTEREGSDRTSLSLPRRTDELVAAVVAVNPNVVVVTQSACAVAMLWVDGPAAIVHAWYQGQECGNAIADVIFGKVNPSGKLPLTFPKRIEDHGSHKWFPGDAENDYAEYGEGVLVGYRWLDEQGTEPLWPFGYGLSYTKFQIIDVAVKGTISAAGDRSASIVATVTNVGDISGSEVLQVYVSSSPAIKGLGRPSAPRSLAGFQKVALRPGESKSLAIHLDAKAVAWFDVVGKGGPGSGGKWRVDRGTYKCYVGVSSRDNVAEVEVTVE
ncbi:Beta-glucosidase B [Colletotrichum fructicola]|uniref:beta-glucosidase n=1 Tax=Colletotrichum fructicola (strain Nara gc5) TaxID=1213859 RepID=A0A7J6IUN8_COLFN|nr:Beta-glucosidase B [Colletotrichum fructicola]KAE9578449.1 Beta-glucosidase B [Colletotrichum fructicola]KAF4426346.1 Beta-glucosidase B [Colletotrichum fructicola]KAF4480587.1 Beta-glucosidase B [Colletotrichum fructicola Nara gc5]